jgi:hypothetical protein
MEQLLTADEVIELLEKHVIAEDEREEFRALAGKYKLVGMLITNPDKQIPLLERCVDFLRSNGIFVFFKVATDTIGKTWAFLVAGELGRIFDSLSKQAKLLRDLSDLIIHHWFELPRQIRAKKKQIDRQIKKIGGYRLRLATQNIHSNKRRLKAYCKAGWKLIEKIDAFLSSDRLKDLKVYYAFKKVI